MIVGATESRTENRAPSFRWKAFAIHLALSLVVLGALLYALFYFWFPGYLFDTDGGWQALRVIAGVDIILGPMLTLIAANPKKSSGELRKDFTVIGLIQVCALSAGTWLAWDNRPYAMIWHDGILYSMPWSAMRTELDALARADELSAAMPRVVSVALSLDPIERDRSIRAAREIGKTPLFDARIYTSWPTRPEVLMAFSELSRQMDTQNSERLTAALTGARSKSADTVLVPAKSRYESYYLLMSAKTGRVIDVLRTPPPRALMNGTYSGSALREVLRENARR